jgi:hypothetical protein
MECSICHTEKSEPIEFNLFHQSCATCKYCTHDCGLEIIQKRLKETESGEPVVIYHDYCHSKKLEEDFKNKPVIITQGHLDMLNAANLMFRAKLDLSVETNQKEAEWMSNKYIHEMELDEKFITLKRLEAVAAMWSIALSKDKARIQIQLDEKERIKYKELKQQGDRLEYEKKRETKSVRAALAGNLTPEEKLREKAIAAFMKLGMTREIAIQQLDAARGIQ